MTDFAYNESFKPFEREGYPLEKVIEWLQKTTGADSKIIDQVVSDTMHLVSQGEKFEVPEEYKDYPDYSISQFMEARVYNILAAVENTKVEILQEMEKTRLEARMKSLVDSDKQMYEAYHGTWSQRNLPTFRRWLGLKD